MANLIFKGHATRGEELHKLLEYLGGVDAGYDKCSCVSCFYYINREGYIEGSNRIPDYMNHRIIMSLEAFESVYPYKVGDKVTCGRYVGAREICEMKWDSDCDCVKYGIGVGEWFTALLLQPYKEDTIEDKGNISDGYHTFNELYEYRLLYNASMFNELAKQGLYDVHKSKRHSDGTIPFGDENWFIVQAELPTGQISNHYEIKDWELFNVPEKEKANPYDGHTPQDVAKRLRSFLTPKPQYPKTYEECCKIIGIESWNTLWGEDSTLYEEQTEDLINAFIRLKVCRDAYWKIAGNWKYDVNRTEEYFYIVNKCGRVVKEHYMNFNYVLSFPTEEMRDAFYDNFKELIESCKELL